MRSWGRGGRIRVFLKIWFWVDGGFILKKMGKVRKGIGVKGKVILVLLDS